MNATLLISSTYERAAQTARIIGTATGLAPTFTALFTEVARPAPFAEKSLLSIRTLWYLFLTVVFRNRPTWRYKDGENFSDIYARIQKTFHYIESLIEAHDSVIVVSHSAYINLMITYMCHSKKLTLRELVRILLSTNSLKNCEVLHVEYVGPTTKGTCPWMLRK